MVATNLKYSINLIVSPQTSISILPCLHVHTCIHKHVLPSIAGRTERHYIKKKLQRRSHLGVVGEEAAADLEVGKYKFAH
jgi:acyl-CoA synthetase (AMP-forming)/AMP-acid ligase II